MLEYQQTARLPDGVPAQPARRPGLAAGELRPLRQLRPAATTTRQVDASAAEDTRQRLMRPGVEITPRKQWPSGLNKLGVTLSGKITDGPAAGRVIGRLTDLGWGARLRQPARRARW